MFCGVLRCFAVFCGVLCACFKRFSQNSTKQTIKKNIQNAQNEQNTLCAIQRNTVLCVFLSLRKCLQSTKNIRKTRPKHCKTSAKHRKTLYFEKHSQNTAKHPQNTRKTPQNIAKHHKTDLLTKQTELANKSLRSQQCTVYSRVRIGTPTRGLLLCMTPYIILTVIESFFTPGDSVN